MSEPRTVGQLLALGERVLNDSTHLFDDHDHAMESQELMAFILGMEDPEALEEKLVPPRRVRERYLSMIARRAGGEPFPMITGRIVFYGLELKVRPGPFVPRPSSELTVARSAKKLRNRQSPVVVDVCTGAGPIAIAIADEFPRADVWGTDIDANGLALGRENARRLHVDNVHFRKGDMYGALPDRLKGKVDLITGHVPYVPPHELEDLPAEVREYEPVFTLSDESDDGLGLMRHAVHDSTKWLKPGGWLLLEMSDDLASKVKKMCKKAGLESPSVASDEDELSIVVEARKPRP